MFCTPEETICHTFHGTIINSSLNMTRQEQHHLFSKEIHDENFDSYLWMPIEGFIGV